MSPRLELVLTIVVCAAGLGYFGWRLLGAEEDEQLLYLGLLVVGAIVAQRALKDVRAKLDAGKDDPGGR